VLESVLEPSKVVSDQYGGSLLKKLDGSTLFARVTAVVENGKTIAYEVFRAVADPKPVRVKAAEVATVVASPQSPMPPGLVDALSPDEMLDLIAYLVSRGDPQGPLFRK
jgi:putative heme-binding domain-containing protein